MNRVRELRKSHGMTLDELGKRIGIQKATVSKYENGTVEMSTSILEKLSGVFGVSIDYIVNNPNADLIPQSSPAPLDESESELVKMSKNLDGESYKTVVNFVKLLAENVERSKRTQLSDDEVKLINDYRFLGEDRKHLAREMVGNLRLAVNNMRKLPSNSNINQVEIGGDVLSPTNITTNQTAG